MLVIREIALYSEHTVKPVYTTFGFEIIIYIYTRMYI